MGHLLLISYLARPRRPMAMAIILNEQCACLHPGYHRPGGTSRIACGNIIKEDQDQKNSRRSGLSSLEGGLRPKNPSNRIFFGPEAKFYHRYTSVNVEESMSVRIGENPKIADTAQNSFSLILITLIGYCIVVNKIGLVLSNFCVYKEN